VGSAPQPETALVDFLTRKFRPVRTERALHALKFFTFHPFLHLHGIPIRWKLPFLPAHYPSLLIISSEGVRSASQVHIPDPDFSGFLKRLPVISDDIVNGAKTMIGALRSRG